MKHCIIIIFFFATGISCGRKSEKEIGYYPSGEVKYEKEVDNNGEIHGHMIEYYENDTVKSNGEWKNGQLDGIVSHFSPKGGLRERTRWLNGEKHGKSMYYNEDGTLWSVTDYIHDRKRKTEFYYGNGNLLERQLFNRKGDMVYFAKIDSSNVKYMEAVLPLIKLQSDTLRLGEEYPVDISLGIGLEGQLKVYTGRLDRKNVLRDTMEIPQSAPNKFIYLFRPTTLGKQNIPFVFSYTKKQGDSLDVDGLKYKKNILVIE